MTHHRKHLREALLDFVERYTSRRGYPPTYDEIWIALRLSSRSHVDHYLDALPEAGLLQRAPRTLPVLRLRLPAFRMPVEGAIAAGNPLEPAERSGSKRRMTVCRGRLSGEMRQDV